MHTLSGQLLLPKAHLVIWYSCRNPFFFFSQLLEATKIVEKHFLVDDLKQVAVYKLALPSNAGFPKAMLLQTLGSPYSLMCARSCLRSCCEPAATFGSDLLPISQSGKPMCGEVCDVRVGSVKLLKKMGISIHCPQCHSLHCLSCCLSKLQPQSALNGVDLCRMGSTVNSLAATCFYCLIFFTVAIEIYS